MKIFLIGYRGTGKTTTGKLLSEMLGYSFIDTDQRIEKKIGGSIRKLVEKDGWASFRAMEQSLLFDLKQTDNAVIATGGGIVLDPENRSFIRENGMVFRLYADMATLLFRIGADPGSDSSRPLLTDQEPEEEIRAVCEQREPFYSQTAHHQIDTTDQTPQQAALIIKRRIENGRQHVWKDVQYHHVRGVPREKYRGRRAGMSPENSPDRTDDPESAG